MNDKQQIWADAQKFGAMFGGFMKAAELLGQAGDSEQFTQEAQQRLDRIKADESSILEVREADRVRFEQAILDLRTTAEREIAQQRLDAASLVQNANASAASILEAANSQATTIKTGAETDAQAIRDGVVTQQATLTDLGTQVTARQSELADLTASVTEKTAQLAELNSQLDAIAARAKR